MANLWGLAFLECALILTSVAAPAAEMKREASKTMLSQVKLWGCQFQNLDIAQAAASPLDLIIIDPDAQDSHGRALDASDVAKLKVKPDGSRRLVLSYISVGEAESYRRYWKEGWRVEAPDWLGPENTNWPGSFVVRYWQDGWKNHLYGKPQSTLDHLLTLGFDGMFLDRVDAYNDWTSTRPMAPQEMVELVDTLAHYARQRQPGFLIIGQNSEELLRNATYTSAVDGVSKESLLYGLDAPGRANKAEDVEWSLTRLKGAKRQGLPIFAIEYLDDPATISAARTELAKQGFVPFFATRMLDRLP